MRSGARKRGMEPATGIEPATYGLRIAIIPAPVRKIKELQMQNAAHSGKESANPQPIRNREFGRSGSGLGKCGRAKILQKGKRSSPTGLLPFPRSRVGTEGGTSLRPQLLFTHATTPHPPIGTHPPPLTSMELF